MYSPWILLDASRTKKVPSGVSRSLSFTSSLGNRGMEPLTWSVRLHPHSPLTHEAHLLRQQNYLEMSPQYHSAS